MNSNQHYMNFVESTPYDIVNKSARFYFVSIFKKMEGSAFKVEAGETYIKKYVITLK